MSRTARPAPLLLCLLLCLSGASGCASQRWVTEPLTVAARCEACGERAGPGSGGRWVPDGRVTCAACLARAVVDDDEAEDLLEEARDLLDDVVGVEVEGPVSVQLASRPELFAGAPELAHPNLRAYCQIREVLRGKEVVSREFHVFALGGLPRENLRGILCHELFHVAQGQAGGASDDADPAFREGAACWVQVLVHRDLDEPRWAEQLLASRDRTYGGGLRRFVRLAEARGQEAALKLALTGKRFPPGY
ncbi:MAG: hypothetical protein AB7N76_07860 [Planctomycetota bacterium]